MSTIQFAGDPSDVALLAAANNVTMHRAAVLEERERLNERDRLIAQAVRAGARLEEIAKAASVSRAAVSLAARRTLPARPGRGGPYSRPRGIGPALTAVSEAARLLDEARARSAAAKVRRDGAIAKAIAEGCGVRSTAHRVGLTPGSISLVVRSLRRSASSELG